jgi:hypothetical protein
MTGLSLTESVNDALNHYGRDEGMTIKGIKVKELIEAEYSPCKRHGFINNPFKYSLVQEGFFELFVWSCEDNFGMSTLLFSIEAEYSIDSCTEVELIIRRISETAEGRMSPMDIIGVLEQDVSFDRTSIDVASCGRSYRRILKERFGWVVNNKQDLLPHPLFTYEYPVLMPCAKKQRIES